MSEDVTALTIKVKTDGIDKADKQLSGLSKSAGSAERATDGLSASFSSFAKIAASAAIAKIGYDLVNTTREFNKINAGLITATGSAENAALAFESIQKFAAQTPYDLAQVSTAFTKLVNMGLDPSERALRSYGNTAAAMGKDMGQFIEAVADATTGEMERLKEFGIKASQEGDKVTFMFRGVATEVGRNTKEIEEYLLRLGEVEFAGAMAERAKTLDGALSNVADSYDQLILALSQQGPESFMTRLAFDTSEALNEATLFVKNNGLEKTFRLVSTAVVGVGDDLTAITKLMPMFAKTSGISMESVIDSWHDFRTLVKVATVEVSAFFDTVERSFEGKKLAEKSKQLLDAGDIEGATAAWREYTDFMTAGAKAREDSIDQVLREGEASKKAYHDAQEEMSKFWDEHKKRVEEAANAPASDVLGQFYKGGEGKGSFGKGAKTDEEKLAEKLRKEAIRDEERRLDQIKDSITDLNRELNEFGKTEAEVIKMRLEALHAKPEEIAEAVRLAGQLALAQLQQDLMTEEESVRQSYERRKEIILANTPAGSDQQNALLNKNEADFNKSVLGDWAKEPVTLEDKLAKLKEEYDAKAEAARGHNELMLQIEQEYTDRSNQIRAEHTAAQLSSASQMFDGLAGLAKTFGGEQSAAYKVLFGISKAFSIAEAMLKMQLAIAEASAKPFPLNIGLMATAAAQGAQIIGAIKGINFSGGVQAYDKGGRIPAGQVGLVGERGAELISGPANVTSRKDTAKLLKGSGESAQPKILVVNLLDKSELVDSFRNSDEFDEVIINSLSRNRQASREALS